MDLSGYLARRDLIAILRGIRPDEAVAVGAALDRQRERARTQAGERLPGGVVVVHAVGVIDHHRGVDRAVDQAADSLGDAADRGARVEAFGVRLLDDRRFGIGRADGDRRVGIRGR